jgi:hypothetical protein
LPSAQPPGTWQSNFFKKKIFAKCLAIWHSAKLKNQPKIGFVSQLYRVPSVSGIALGMDCLCRKVTINVLFLFFAFHHDKNNILHIYHIHHIYLTYVTYISHRSHASQYISHI